MRNYELERRWGVGNVRGALWGIVLGAAAWAGVAVIAGAIYLLA